MRIFRLVTASFLLCLGSAGCDFSWAPIIGSGQEGHETRDVAAFTGVLVTDSIEARITVVPDQPQSVEISGDDNLVPMVQTRVSSGKLVLDLPQSIVFDPKLPLVVTIRATALSTLEASDSARADADVVEGGHVLIASSDSAEVTVGSVAADGSLSVATEDSAVSKIGEVVALGRVEISAADSSVVDAGSITADDDITVKAEDSSEVTLRGDAPALEVELSDSSHLDALDLTVETVVIHASSSSTADVCATASIDATLSDSSAVNYTCDPESVTQDLEDSSALTKK